MSNLKVALVCIAKNEDHYIDEWIEYHKKLGFDDIIIYQNNWSYTGNSTDITLKTINGEVKQLVAYQSFMREYHKIYDWAAFIDIDEFIVLKQQKTIQEFLSLYGGVNSSIAMNWVYFGNNNQTFNGEYSVIKRFTKRQITPDKHIKIIAKINPNSTFQTPHCLRTQWMDTNGKVGSGSFNTNPTDEVIQLNHYFCKTEEEFQEKINRGRADTIHPAYQRKMDEYHQCNHNEIEDLTAYNFMYNETNNNN